MKKTKLFAAFLALSGLIGGTAVAATGDCYKNAKSLSGSFQGNLVPEYDLEDGSYSDNGVFYFKFTLKRGKPCTVWGSDAQEIAFDGWTEEDFYDGDGDKYDDFSCPSISFDTDSYDDSVARGIIYSDDWDEEDTKSVTYYVVLSGDVGQSFSINFAASVQEESIPTGYDEEHSKKITPSATIQKWSGKIYEGSYYLTASGLKAGDRVAMWTEPDAETDELSVSNVYETAACEWQEFNRPEATDATVHTLLAATAAGSVDFALSGITGDTFTLYYVKVDTASDPGDNNASGAVSITPKTDKQSVVKSLSATDAVDWYKFSAAAGTYYSFTIDTNQGAAPAIAFYSDASGTTAVAGVANRTTEVDAAAGRASYRFLAPQKGTYTVKVSNGGANTVYTLTHSSALVGEVKLGAATYSAKEDAASVAVKVMRTAKDGYVRVQYTTIEGTAKPGEDYIPATGILEWESGDNSARTVDISLIPDLYATYEGAGKEFTFKIETIPEEYVGTEEYVPAIGTPSVATVTLTETSKAVPGTIALAAYGEEKTEIAVPKKPVATVAAGSDCVLWFSRTVGSNGKVGVTVTATKGTAVAGTDFTAVTETLVWDDGDTEDKSMAIPTFNNGSAADKTFTVKIAAAAKYEGETLSKATLTAAAATVTIRNPEVALTFEEWNATRGTAAPTLKAAKAGTWFIGNDGILRSATPAKGQKNELTLTVAGPGVLHFKAGSTSGNMTYTLGKVTEVCDGEKQLVLPKGNQTVKFTVTNVAGAAEMLGWFEVAPYFEWVALPLATAVSPADKTGVVAVDTAVASWSGTGNKYLVSLAEKAADIGTGAAVANFMSEGTSLDLSPYVTAGKTYYWRVDSLYDAAGLYFVNTNAVWSFKTVAAGAAQAAVQSSSAEYTTDPESGAISFDLSQLVAFNMTLEGGSTYSLASGKLPDGLKLAGNSIAGVPTKAGHFTVSVLVKNGATSGVTRAINFNVTAAPMLAGTFNGVAEGFYTLEEGESFTNQNETVSALNVTVSATGAITAKATVAGVAYAFKGSGYTAYDEATATASAILTNSVKVGTTTVHNVLELSVYNAGDSLEDLAVPSSATLALNIPNAKKTATHLMTYEFPLLRDNRKETAVAQVLAGWTGYYTVSLPVTAADADLPQGAGYLTVTLDAKGAAKVSGKLADGTSLSLSGIAGLMYDTEGALSIPLCYSKGTSAFGGWLRLVVEDGVVVSDPSNSFIWADSSLAKSYSGETGFVLDLQPVGGFYDKLFNLQAYYLNTAVSLGFENGVFEGYDEMIPSGAETLLLYPGIDEPLAVTLSGNNMSVSKQVLAKNAETKLNDFENSVNPCNAAIKFARATGIFTGTFSLWYADNAWVGDETVQKQLSGIKYEGVLTPAKAAGSMFGDAPGLGFANYTMTVGKRKFAASWLFGLWGEDITAANAELWQSEGQWNYSTDNEEEEGDGE